MGLTQKLADGGCFGVRIANCRRMALLVYFKISYALKLGPTQSKSLYFDGVYFPDIAQVFYCNI